MLSDKDLFLKKYLIKKEQHLLIKRTFLLAFSAKVKFCNQLLAKI